ncbi:MAG: hypothetical protein FRX49_02862 [Trebouxia sp. A1-2]|nr:MAG: hypothetical protein FRX49_02862 [Trebouxia sp. A1-2]
MHEQKRDPRRAGCLSSPGQDFAIDKTGELVTEQTYKTDANVARAEFSSLVNTVQSSLAELRLEVSTAQQLSNHAASQLPHLSNSADNPHLQWDLYGASGAAVSPRISARMPGEVNAGNGIMRQHALMQHLQESVANHTSQIASVEGSLNVSTTEMAQLKANVTELAATAQQMQARTTTLAQQQSEMPVRSDMVQMQDSMCSVEASLQRLQAAQAAADTRWRTAEAAMPQLKTADGLEQRMSQQGFCECCFMHQLPMHQLPPHTKEQPSQNVQMHQLDSGVTGRLEAVEGHLQFIAGVLGTKLAGTPHAQPPQAVTPQTAPAQLAAGTAWDPSGISIMQQLSDLHTEMSRLSQDQLRVRSDAQTSENVSSDLAELSHRLHGQEAEAQQLQQAHSDALQQAAMLQQGLSAQEVLTEQMQQTQQSLTLTVDGVASDLARHVDDMQDAHSQLETQHASTSCQINEEMSQHHVDLRKLRAASAAHDEQLKQYGETLGQYEAQLASSAASQIETHEALKRLSEQTGALSSHNTGLRRASETGSKDPGSHVEDRLTSLEADVAHSTAATDAMSSIIDQVAQLGEQQVQGCTTRITHLETDLVHRVDGLKQQQDTQTATMSDMTAHIARLQAQVKDGDKSPGVAQIAAQLAELNGAVLELQTASAGGSAKAADSELQADVDALRGQVGQLRANQAEQQSAGSSLASIEHDVAVVRKELTQLQSSQAAQRPADPALSKLGQDLAALSAGLSQTQKDHATQVSVTSSAIDQKVESIRSELRQLHDQQTAQSSAHKLYSHLEQDVAALKGQLSQLDRTQGSQLAHEQWQEETQQLRVELAACVKTEADTGAAVAQHATHLSTLEKRVTEMYAEMQSSAAQAHPSSSTDSAGQTRSQTEVEELNERLFELRVELQNLADDTTISVASIKRKVALAQKASEAAGNSIATSNAGWLELQQQVHGLRSQVDASKETQAEVQVLKQQLASLQVVTTELAAHLTKLAEKHASAPEEGQTGQAALQQRLRKIELTVADALVEVASQMKALEARVTALASLHTSPTSASLPARHATTSRPAASVRTGETAADTTSATTADARLGSRQAQAPQADGFTVGSSSGRPETKLSGLPEHQESKVPSSASELLNAAPHRSAAAPQANLSGAVADSRVPVPDLMTFSPAVGTRLPGLNRQPVSHSLQATAAAIAASHEADPLQQHAQPSTASMTQQLHTNLSTAMMQPTQPILAAVANPHGNTLHVQPGVDSQPDSRPSSPMPGISFYDNAVFGSPTPTPSPQSQLHDPSPPLESPGSSPRPQQQEQHHFDLLVSRAVDATTSPQGSMPGLSLHHNKLWTHETASISIPTTAAAAGPAVAYPPGAGVHRTVAGLQSGSRSGMAPLPTVPAGSSRGAQSVSSVQQSLKPGAQHSTEHSPGVSLNTHFQLSGSSLLDESDDDSADEEEVGHQLTVIQQQLARDDIDDWERDILMSEWDLLNKVKHNEAPKT